MGDWSIKRTAECLVTEHVYWDRENRSQVMNCPH